MSGLVLPEGWRYTPTTWETRCDTCGHVTPAAPGSLRAPDGSHWPLIGNASERQERQMVDTIVEAHTQTRLQLPVE